MGWLQLHFETGPAAVAALETAVLAAGALSVALSDAADNPILEPDPDSTPLWANIRLSALFPATLPPDAVAHRIAMALGQPLPPWRAEHLDDRNWIRAWLDDYRPLRFGRLMICPTGFAADPDCIGVMLDPGLAFGTGTHPTTALCLDWLAGQPLEGKTVVDYGCGSGILAIAALKLGAASAIGIDHDPQALTASRDNARRNGIADTRLQLHLPADCRPTAAVDLVLANILAGPLIALADHLPDLLAPGGQLVLSGILDAQADAVIAAYQPRMRFETPALRDGWVRLNAHIGAP